MYFVIIRLTFILILKLLINICFNMHFTLHNCHLLYVKVIEKCTNFYFGTEKLPPKF